VKEIVSLNRMFFHDMRNGWVVGRRHDSPFPTALLLHTTDGGETWQDVTSLLDKERNERVWMDLYAIKFLDNGIGWISGSGVLWKTNDRGKTWKRFQLIIEGETSIALSKIQFFDDMNGYANYGPVRGAVPQDLVKTVDGGRTWRVIDSTVKSDSASLIDFHFLNVRKGFAIFNNNLFETIDGGRHWINIEIENVTDKSPFHLESIFFLDENHGWVAGRDGLLLFTNDAGKTWNRLHN
jgi:photosystem II stability/assembly factor-like uncharacterized protein